MSIPPERGRIETGGSTTTWVTQSSPVLPPRSGRTQRPLYFCTKRDPRVRISPCERQRSLKRGSKAAADVSVRPSRGLRGLVPGATKGRQCRPFALDQGRDL